MAVDSDNVISIHGAREHNLKNISVDIPRDSFVVITGVSGSGKSTLAFDLLFAEGQRRFLDSMNVYARQFVEQMARPDVDLITGIPPTVSIEQRNSRGGGKSTVATVTEIYHFVRLLFSKLGTQFCPRCDLPVKEQTSDQLRKGLDQQLKKRGDLLLLAPVVRNRKGFHTDIGEWAAKHGYAEVRADGRLYRTDQPLRLDRFREHDVEVVTGVLERKGQKPAEADRLIEETLRIGKGLLFALGNDKLLSVHSTHRACHNCGESFPPLDPKMLSYNSSQGWCPECRGFGELFYLPDVERGARADAIEESWFGWQEGNREPCPECEGTRLNRMARAVKLEFEAGRALKKNLKLENPISLVGIGKASVEEAASLFDQVKFTGPAGEISRDILPEIRERLKFLIEVGLGYLALDRAATTLSGGEAQRIRLAAQLGSNLTGVLYILDEPTIGLHARDNEQLLGTLSALQKRGNTLVVVEHDEETMRRADHIIDLGPGAGEHGGEVVATGNLKELLRDTKSLTGRMLGEKRSYPARGQRRPVNSSTPLITISGAKLHNLKNVVAKFPAERFVVVTGVSGSGKSTLIRECLVPALQAHFKKEALPQHLKLSGLEDFTAVYEVDQNPIGRTPRSTPATYVGFFDEIRELFAQTPEARMRGYAVGRFSFNSAAGRCPECEGAGTTKLEMNFLPPAFVRCETCQGARFNPETLDVTYKGKNICEVLAMSVSEALEFFAPVQKVKRPLEALRDTGLEYLRLGQTSPTLSGGEAQRVKLVTHLLSGLKPANLELDLGNGRAGRKPKKNFFVLEEPTIGLHMADVRRLIEVLQRLVDAGHTVIVIEHNLDLIAEADWVIDIGPEAGARGGEIIAAGTPEKITSNRHSHTGRFLRELLR